MKLKGDHNKFDVSDNENGSEPPLETTYACEVCSKTFPSKQQFLEHHMIQFGHNFTCCKCQSEFSTSTELYNHYDLHKATSTLEDVEVHQEIVHYNEEVVGGSVEEEEEEEETVEISLSEDQGAISTTDELLYILDDSQCVNEVVIEEVDDVKSQPKENYTIVHNDGSVNIVKMVPSSSKKQLSSTKQVKPPASKRRHEVPHFSATSYVVLSPNEDIDMQHYKCLRCEQLFINKFVFYRHIEKGKCYINSCDVCSERFTKNTDFYLHYISEHTDRAICNFCFRTFMYEKNVKEHMLRHLDQFRHRCEDCNKGFYTIREYRNHYKNRHMGIRHKCEICNRSFADEYYFKRHMASHQKATKSKDTETDGLD